MNRRKYKKTFLIALVGIDGAGKSTLADSLRRSLVEAGYSVLVLDRWSVLDRAIFPDCRFLVDDLAQLKQCIGEVHGPSRALLLFFLQKIVFDKQATIDESDVWILDGYWMKHAAAELVLGCPPGLIQALAEQFPLPDLTFYVDVEPAMALQRKNTDRFNTYECGLDGAHRADSFLKHQNSVRAVLQNWSDESAWCRVDGARSHHEVASATLLAVLRGFERLGLASGRRQAT